MRKRRLAKVASEGHIQSQLLQQPSAVRGISEAGEYSRRAEAVGGARNPLGGGVGGRGQARKMTTSVSAPVVKLPALDSAEPAVGMRRRARMVDEPASLGTDAAVSRFKPLASPRYNDDETSVKARVEMAERAARAAVGATKPRGGGEQTLALALAKQLGAGASAKSTGALPEIRGAAAAGEPPSVKGGGGGGYGYKPAIRLGRRSNAGSKPMMGY